MASQMLYQDTVIQLVAGPHVPTRIGQSPRPGGPAGDELNCNRFLMCYGTTVRMVMVFDGRESPEPLKPITR